VIDVQTETTSIQPVQRKGGMLRLGISLSAESCHPRTFMHYDQYKQVALRHQATLVT